MTEKTVAGKKPRRAVPEWAILLALLLVALIVFVLSRALAPAGRTAVIEQDGKTVAEVSLAAVQETQTFSVRGAVIEVTAEGARFADSDCPDRICVETGLLRRAGESAVCLPNRVSVRITGSGGADAVTG